MASDNRDLGRKQVEKSAGGNQGIFDFQVERETEVQGIGMGVFRDGTPFLSQRGLAALCGVQNAHIGTIDRDWSEEVQKPRITIIKGLISKRGDVPLTPSVNAKHNSRNILAYPADVCLAILEYYAFEAGSNLQTEALTNFRVLAGKGLQSFIYTNLGYDPSGANTHKFDK